MKGIDKKRTESLTTVLEGGHVKWENAGSQGGTLPNGLCG